MRLRFWSNYADRLRAEGFLRTATYSIGLTILSRLGVEVKYLYQFDDRQAPPEAPADSEVELALIRRMDELTAADRRNLVEFEGKELTAKFEREFADHHKAAVARQKGGGLVSVGWIAPAEPHLRVDYEATVLIRDCFTLRPMRGRGLYPAVLRAACDAARSEAASGSPRIVVTCAFSNHSSLRGILKSGFRRIGTIVRVWRWRWVCFRYKGRTIRRSW